MQKQSLFDTIKKVYDKFKPKSYLEVSDEFMGLRFLDLANSVDSITNITGVGFWPKQDLKSLPDKITIYPVSSDYYIHSPYMTDTWKNRFDMIFLDGYKKVELVLKNLILFQGLLNPNGIFVVTNLSPDNAQEAERAKFGNKSTSKCGDCYRLLTIMKKTNNTAIKQILCEDGGLFIMQNMDMAYYNLNMVALVRDVLDIPFEKRETSYDITTEEYFQDNIS